MPETEEERRIRKERERAEKEKETPEQRAARKERERLEKEARGKKEETPEERAARKERERLEKEKETPEQRAARKERERLEKEKETPEERAARKEREARESKAEETPEQRAARKERERLEKEKETPEQRAARKEREARESEERAARKEREAREKAEKAERDAKKEVVHKPLPAPIAQQQATKPVATAPQKVEPTIVGRNPNAAPPKKEEKEEEYDDDFVDGFEVEQMIEAQKAVAAENAALKKTSTPSSQAGQTPTNNGAPQFVGQSRFGADDLQRQKYRAQFEKDLARATALRRLVDLDDVSAIIADIPPLSEYDMYIRNFGGAGRSQTGVQAPPADDKIDVEVQAERVTSKSKGAQCPEDLGLFPEKLSALSVPSADAEGTEGSPATSGKEGPSYKARGPVSVDAALLSSFLSRVFPVMRTLLDESNFGSVMNRQKSTFPFSSTFTTFNAKVCAGRPVLRVCFSPLAPQYLLCVHGARKTKPSAAEATAADRYQGLAVLWNSNDPTLPDKIFIHSSALIGGCFSPSRPHLIYAACENGSVCAWDTREPDSMHLADVRGEAALRSPSFSTEWQVDNHDAPIASIAVAGYNSVLGSRREENDQIVTMDRKGQINFWMVNDGNSGKGGDGSPARNRGAGAAGSAGNARGETDHGQLINSVVRIFRASSMKINQSDCKPSLSAYSTADTVCGAVIGASDLDFSPTDSSRFVVAAGATIQHLSRFSSITAPSSYAPHSQFFGQSASSPSSVSFSTMDSRIILGGYSDGTVRVYLKDEGLPQLSVPVSSFPIRQVRSSPSVKLISFALDDNGQFFILDHGIEEKEVPVVQCSLSGSNAGRCLAFDVPCEDKADSQMVFGFESGQVQLHILNQQWLAPAAQRSEKWI